MGRRDQAGPPKVVARLEWLAHLADSDRIMAESGLPDCDAATALWDALTIAPPGKRSDAIFAQIESHDTTCERCTARAKFVTEHLGPMPMPPGLDPPDAWEWFLTLSDRPRRALGAGFAVGAWMFVWPFISLFWRPASEFPAGNAFPINVALGVAMGLGFGELYHWSRVTCARFGLVGRIVSGIVVAACLFVPIAYFAPFWFGYELLSDASDWWGLALVIGIAGPAFSTVLGDD
jgi:hypothetical protein